MNNIAIVENHKQIPYGYSGVYVLLNDKNEPLYIGQSTNLRIRVYQHSKGEISRLINKIIVVTTREIYKLEKFLITKLQPKLNGHKFKTWNFSDTTKEYESILTTIRDNV